MKHLLILVVLAIFLTLALVGMEVASQGSPISPISPVPSPTLSWIELPTRVISDNPEFNECVDRFLRDYPYAGTKWAEAYCRGDAPLPTILPTPTPYVQGQVPGSDEFLPPPPRPAPTSTPTPVSVVAGEFVGTWWKNEVTECNLYSDGYRIVRIQCERCIEDLLNEGY